MLTVTFAIFLTLILAVSTFSATPKQTEECCEVYCYDSDASKEQYKNFATKTPYDLVKGSPQYDVPGNEQCPAHYEYHNKLYEFQDAKLKRSGF